MVEPLADREAVAGRNAAGAERLIVAVAAGVLLGLILTQGHRTEKRVIKPLHSPNDRSRFLTVRALGDYGTYAIDQAIQDSGWKTIDKVRRPDDGLFYSSKPPLLPTLLAGEYRALRWLSGGRWTFDESLLAVVRTLVATANWVPFVLFLVLLGRHLGRHEADGWTRCYVLAAAGLGTYLTGFAITLNNHLPAAFSCFFALYAAVRIIADGRRDWWLFMVAGLFAAFMACNELPSGSLAAVLFLWLLCVAPQRTVLLFVPAALVPLAAFFWTNYLVTGDLLPAYLHKDWYHYPGSYWDNPRGIDAINEPWWVYLLNITVGHHGVLSLTPVFVFCWLGMLREPLVRGPLRGFALVSLAITAVIFAFYVGIPVLESYGLRPPRSYGGMCQGFRWVFWLIPLWLLFLPSGLEPARRHRWVAVLAVLFLVVSIASAFYAVRNPWSRPWLHQLFWTYGVTPY